MIKIELEDIKLKPNEKIPRIIHYCWFGGNPLPPLAEMCISSWRKFLPDYKIICWNEESFDTNQHPYTKESFETKKWAFITDYVRLYVLKQFGGIYMDTDIEILKPLDQFMHDPAFTCFEPPNYLDPEKVFIQTGLIGAEKDNAWISKMLSYYNNRNFLDNDGNPELIPNPIPLTKITIEDFGLIPNHAFQELNNAVVIYPKEYFCPINWRDKKVEKTKNTFAIHHFAGSWIEEHKAKSSSHFKRFLSHLKNHIFI